MAVALDRPTAIMWCNAYRSAWRLSTAGCFFLWCVRWKQRTFVFIIQTWCTRGIGAGIEAFFSIPIPNRCQRYQSIPSTRCQYRSHPSPQVGNKHWSKRQRHRSSSLRLSWNLWICVFAIFLHNINWINCYSLSNSRDLWHCYKPRHTFCSSFLHLGLE